MPGPTQQELANESAYRSALYQFGRANNQLPPPPPGAVDPLRLQPGYVDRWIVHRAETERFYGNWPVNFPGDDQASVLSRSYCLAQEKAVAEAKAHEASLWAEAQRLALQADDEEWFVVYWPPLIERHRPQAQAPSSTHQPAAQTSLNPPAAQTSTILPGPQTSANLPGPQTSSNLPGTRTSSNRSTSDPPILSSSSEASSQQDQSKMATPDSVTSSLPHVNIAGPSNSHSPPAGPADSSAGSQKGEGKNDGESLAMAVSQLGEGKRDGERLATDLDQLKVQSPTSMTERLPPVTESAINTISNQPTQPMTIQNLQQRQESTNSNSTENSDGHPHPPSSLSDYGPEGFPKLPMAPSDPQPSISLVDAQAQPSISAIDRRIMEMNGTDTVRDASSISLAVGSPFPSTDAPRGSPFGPGMEQQAPTQPLRQTSDSTTSASTSSEEEDWTVPTLALPGYINDDPPINRPRTPYFEYQPTRSPRTVVHSSPRISGSPHRSGPNGQVHNHVQGSSDPVPRAPSGATAHHHGGVPGSGRMQAINVESSEDEDDGGSTVGDRRSRSRSTSSEIRQGPPLHRANANAKGKRKADSDAAAARGKTIPSSSFAGKKPSGRRTSAKENDDDAPPRKRRRSEISNSQIDPSLHDDTNGMDVDEEFEGSDEEDVVNSGDSEYEGTSKAQGKARGGRSKPPTPSKAVAKKAKPGKTVAKPSASNGTFQCDYISPLPPYNRCPETFTRVYDLPRHKSRHATREGELVNDGKLAMDKALLWKAEKDKPPIQCGTCSEKFTRRDALKRHQANQGHKG